jgi:hypothetical protein
MKPLFKNYNFQFDKNEKKIIISFCKQIIKQAETDQKLFAEAKAFNSILEKLNSNTEAIKLTKDEYFRFKNQVTENLKFIKVQTKKGWFFKKWLYKSLFAQYTAIYDKYLKD